MTRLGARLLGPALTEARFWVSFSPKNHNASTFVDLTLIALEAKFLR